MAERRMFAKSIIFSDDFTEMSSMARTLYVYLSMAADDDGFLNNPKNVQRMSGAGDEDMELLKEKGYIISFDSGVIAIKDWKTNNSIKKDRYKPTVCKKEKRTLEDCCDNDGDYQVSVAQNNKEDEQTENREVTSTEQTENVYATSMELTWNQNGTKVEPQDRLGKDRLGKDRLDKGSVGKNRGDNAHAGAEELLPPSDTVFSCEGENDFPTPNNSIGDVNENTTPFGNVSEHPTPTGNVTENTTPFDNENEILTPFGNGNKNTTPFGNVNENPSPSDNSFGGKGYACNDTPTLKEIKDYCQKESLTFVNSEIFFNHYDAFSWRYPDGTRIKNWQALLKKWNAQDREKRGKNTYQGRETFYGDSLYADTSKLEV